MLGTTKNSTGVDFCVKLCRKTGQIRGHVKEMRILCHIEQSEFTGVVKVSSYLLDVKKVVFMVHHRVFLCPFTQST